MRKRDLDYVICALLYSMKKQHADRWGGFRFFLNSLFTHVMLLFGMNKYKALRIWVNNRERIELGLSDKEWGIDMNQANNWLDYVALGYCGALGVILDGTLIKVFQIDNVWVMFFFAMILYCVWLIYIQCYILHRDQYLVYFRVFDCENTRWHEKWMYITYALTLGSIGSLIGGGIFIVFIFKHM